MFLGFFLKLQCSFLSILLIVTLLVWFCIELMFLGIFIEFSHESRKEISVLYSSVDKVTSCTGMLYV